MTELGAPHIGRSLLRREDRRLLTGRGQFIADLELPRMLHAASSGARLHMRGSARSTSPWPPQRPEWHWR